MDFDIAKTIISKNEAFLRRHLVLSSTVISKLREKGVITSTAEKLLTRENSAVQITRVLTTLKLGGLRLLKLFIEVLRETCHGWLAEALLETQIDGQEARKVLEDKVMLKEIFGLNRSFKSLNDTCDGETKLAYYRLKRRPDTETVFLLPLNREHLRPGNGWKENRREQTMSLFGDGRKSPITEIAEQVRNLEMAFNKQKVTSQYSMSALKQEELALRELLKRNFNEQEELLAKLRVLDEMEESLKRIIKRTSKI